MIWSRGEVIPDDALRVSVLDRTFEHGLGLFETFRTWDGHPTLLPRHLERLQRSAQELELPIDPGHLPDVLAIARLTEGCGMPPERDVRLRITLSGGVSEAGHAAQGSTIWMTAGPLPPPLPTPGVRIARSILVDPDDALARHKTLNYWRMRMAHSRALEAGADEVLCVTPDGLVREATRSNVFLVEGSRLTTPSTDGPLLPGIMRRIVLDHAPKLGLEVVEGPARVDSLATADEAFLTNSVRGMLPISRLFDRVLPAPGPVTRRLWGAIRPWLESGGTTS
jgi:branched-subunit amino acid aminotransferase/4-amino-4-deoxychorismate lyase